MKENILVSGLPFSGTTVVGLSISNHYNLSYFHEPFSAKPNHFRFRVASEEWFLDRLTPQQLRGVENLSSNPTIKQILLNMGNLSNAIHLSYLKIKLTSGLSNGSLIKDPNLLTCTQYFIEKFTRIICVKPLKDQIRSFIKRDFRLTHKQFMNLARHTNQMLEWRDNRIDDIVMLLLLLDHERKNFEYCAEIRKNTIQLYSQNDKVRAATYQINTKTDLFSISVKKKMLNKSGVFHHQQSRNIDGLIEKVLERYFEKNEKSMHYY